MIHKPHVDWFVLAPTNALLAATAVALLGAVLFPARVRRVSAAAVCAAGYAIAFGFAVALYARTGHGHAELCRTKIERCVRYGRPDLAM